jgi:hypothetical protein
MKRIVLFFLLAAATTIAHAQKELVVDANAELRTVSGTFTSIKVSGGIDLYLSQSPDQAVAISASEDKYKEGIKTVVENGTLRIYYDGDKGLSLKNRKMRAYVSFKTLEKLEASGASDVHVSGELAVDALEMQLSGASDFKGRIKVSSLKLELSGASDVSIEGTATVITIESSGASDVKGFGLVTDICTAKVSGASDVNITVNKELNAHASGASEIYYKGDGVIKEMHSSGASSIAKRDS